MLMPKRMRWRKHRRGRMKGKAQRGNRVEFGAFGIMADECGWVTARQIEAARIAMTRHVRRGGKVWIRVFPDKPYTKKPLEQRMGKGKASVEGYVAVIRPGRVLFEMAGVSRELAAAAMDLAIRKLPLRCKFVTREESQDIADAITGTPRIRREMQTFKIKMIRDEDLIAKPADAGTEPAAGAEPAAEEKESE